MARKPKTFTDLIGLWPDRPSFARAIGVKNITAQQMAYRDSINAKYFGAVIKAAKKAGLDEITLELLSEIAERRKAA